MRWLLAKDLRILRRSPLLVALLVLYPVVIAVLIGFALSKAPDKPKVAFYNALPPSASTVELGGQRIDITTQGKRLFDAIDPVVVHSREAAIQKVRDGEVLGALVIPKDLTQKLQSGLEPGTVEVYYNADDPAKRQFVENTIKSQVQTANAALTKRIAAEALDLLKLISTGGNYHFLGQDISVLGLERSEQILRAAQRDLPASSPERAEIEKVDRLRQAGARQPLVLRRRAERGGPAAPGERQVPERGAQLAELVRRGPRGGGVADVHHAAPGGRHARPRARGERLPAAGPGARVPHRPAGGEGRPRHASAPRPSGS